MSTQLDLKYRPQKFADVLGNEGVKQLLLIKSKKNEFVNQSMMFSGPKGCGKTSLARLVARSIVCNDLQDGEPCNECVPCQAVLDETSTSVEELDAASQGTVDKIRTMVRDVEYEPLDGSDVNVYIVDEAQRLSKAAQDAFLKAIENRQLLVIFCTTEPHKIQGPIRDRLEEYPVRPPTEEELIGRMKKICENEQIKISDDILRLIAQIHGNTPRSSFLAIDSLSNLGEITDDSVRRLFRFDSYKLIDAVLTYVDSDPVKAFEYLDTLSNSESPTWIRDSIVSAIASAFRESIGARSTYLVPTHFFPIRQRDWIKLAQKIGGIDRPSIADIEAALLEDSRAVPEPTEFKVEIPRAPIKIPSVKAIGDVPSIELSSESEEETKPEPKIETEKPKIETKPEPDLSVEIEGVRFSSDENLTSLDDKIERDPNELKNNTERDLLKVELDKTRVPITSREFARLLKDD